MTDNNSLSPLDDLLSMDSLTEDLNDNQVTEVKEMAQVQKENTEQSLFNRLNENQQAQAKQLATQIDIHDSQSVLSYGAEAQEKLGEFSQLMLNKVQNQDVGPIGDALSDLMYRLNEADPEELEAEDNRGLFKKLFSKVKKSAYEITAKYQQIGAQIDQIAVKLDREKEALMKDSQILEQLYQKNKDFFDALNLYIAAGELKMEELENTIIPEAEQKALATNDQMDAQVVNDLTQFYNRLEKRTYDLKLARQITIQQAPQIRLIQNTNQALAEKIQSSINTAIPLWKNQVAIALTLLRQKQAVTAQRQVSETTNDLLKKNSEMLKISAIETAKENERGTVDIETLKKTQSDLVTTIQETMRIQSEGRAKRQEAEKELVQLEDELKQQVLSVVSKNQN